MKRGIFALIIMGISGFVLWVLSTGMPSKSIPALGSILSPFTGVWKAAEPTDLSSLTMDKPLSLPLKQRVSVKLDDRLVPHIDASNIEDALMVQGYLEAKFRLWQMEISVRSAAGELSEILGTGSGNAILKKDLLERRKGTRRAAEIDMVEWRKDPKTMSYINAYVAGVNAYIDNLKPADYPLEYKLVGAEPRRWEMLHSALFAQNMATVLASRNYDIEDTNFAAIFGTESYDSLFIKPNKQQSPVISTDKVWDFKPAIQTAATSDLSVTPHQPKWEIDEGIGSNNWAVNGAKTKSGYPILCNDPHLGLTVPSIWFELQFNLPDNRIHGVSLPGIPGVFIGFNQDASWGTTNVGHDVLDWYRIEWADKARTKYIVDSQELNVDFVIEEIKVKGEATIYDTIRQTIWGPIVHEDPAHQKYDLAMKWVLDLPTKPREPISFVQLMLSKTVDDFFDAMSDYSGPAQNFIFATKTNDIAIQCKGTYPIRKMDQGRFIQMGNTTANAWTGFIPADQIPKEVNPPRNFVASANQNTTDNSYPYFYFGGFDNYRGRTIVDKLSKMEPKSITAKDMMDLQLDNFSFEAADALPVLKQRLLQKDSSLAENKVFKTLDAWDYEFEADKIAPTYYHIWWTKVQALVWDEIAAQKERGVAVRRPASWRTIELLGENPNYKFFDKIITGTTENASDIVAESFEFLLDSVSSMSTDELAWYKHLDVTIGNLSKMEAFGVGQVKTNGYKYAINSNRGIFGPSWRMVIELGDDPKGHVVYPGGQSGNPGSPYFQNMVDTWAAGEYYTVRLKDDVSNPMLEYDFEPQNAVK